MLISCVVGGGAAEILDPGLLRLREVVQHIGVHQRLVAGMTDAEAEADAPADDAEGEDKAEG